MGSYVYLDTETTGLSPNTGARLVEVAIIDDSGASLFNSLINPGIPIPLAATNIHGISDSMVRKQPRVEDVLTTILKSIDGREVVIYNAEFDVKFFPNRLLNAAQVHCAMKAYSAALGQRRWVKLVDAAKQVGHTWGGQAHRALADAQACRSVWRWLKRSSREYGPASNPVTTTSIPAVKTTSVSTTAMHEMYLKESEQRRDIPTIVTETVDRSRREVPSSVRSQRIHQRKNEATSPIRSPRNPEEAASKLAGTSIAVDGSRDTNSKGLQQFGTIKRSSAGRMYTGSYSYNCPWCNATGATDSHIVRCSRCGRQSFTG